MVAHLRSGSGRVWPGARVGRRDVLGRLCVAVLCLAVLCATVLAPGGRAEAAPLADSATGGRMIVPMSGYVTQRAFDTGCGDGTHEGYDIAAPLDTKVYAAAPGTAYLRSDPNGFGPNYVFIQHTGGWDTIYGHTDRVLVPNGSHVRKGQLIALEGNLGDSTGPHLHFQVDHHQPYTGIDLGQKAFPCHTDVTKGAVIPRRFAGLVG